MDIALPGVPEIILAIHGKEAFTDFKKKRFLKEFKGLGVQPEVTQDQYSKHYGQNQGDPAFGIHSAQVECYRTQVNLFFATTVPSSTRQLIYSPGDTAVGLLARSQ